MHIIKYKLRDNHISVILLGILSLHFHFNAMFRRITHRILQQRMKRKIARIANKRKIRVGFLVSEPSKWSYHSVYNEFKKSSRYEPVILVTRLLLQHNGGAKLYKSIDDCYAFFHGMGYDVEYAYDTKNNKYIPLDKLNIDIVFYQQPWELHDSQQPFEVSKYAITAYIGYGFDLMNTDMIYTESFHRWIDFYFTESDQISKYIDSRTKDVKNLYVTGCPKLDAYLDIKTRKPKKPIIIYAPHHSFESDGLNMATFQYNGRDIFNLAKQTASQFDWVLKPHPRFKHAVVSNNIMTQDEIEQYYKQWESFGRIYEGGDYINIFANSTAMITDCCSFLAEYLPSKKPLFHLLNPKEDFNDFAKSFICGYYSIFTSDELIKQFNRVVIDGDDYKKSERLSKIHFVFNDKLRSGPNMFKILDDKIRGIE